ncbi:MAG: CPBP family intramembrane metalloprotease, partial [Flavobacteriaceae bacterium]|nr:CPBP family intramembrane metalloprotease [Flavobacteriaceae bacterium]
MSNYLKLGWIDVIWAVFIFFSGAVLTGYAYRFLAGILNSEPYILSPVSTLTTYLLIYLVYYLVLLYPRQEKFRISYSLKGFGLFPIVLLLFIGQYFISEYVTGLIPTEGEFFGTLYQSMTNALLGGMNKYPEVTFISVCVTAPVLEEIFFRGFLLKGMLNNKVRPAKAIVISALIFGGIHFYPWQVVGGVLSGLVLGLVFYKTGSLLSCTLLHFLNNFAAFLLFTKYKSLETPDLGF